MRIAVPIVATLLGVLFIWAIFSASGPSGPAGSPPTASTPADQQAEQVAKELEQIEQIPPAEPTVEPDDTAAEQPSPAPITAAPAQTLRPVGDDEARVSRIGSLDPSTGYRMQVTLTGWGAGIYDVQLAQHFVEPSGQHHYPIQAALEAQDYGQLVRAYPFAARGVAVDGQWIDLSTVRWRLVGPGHYEIDLVNEQDQPVLHITRQYMVSQGVGGYDIQIHQQVRNLTDVPHEVVWHQNIQGDLPGDDAAYLGDMRLLMSGYLDPGYDPTRRFVFADDGHVHRRDVLSKGASVWPTDDAPASAELVWLAAMNRYFAVAVHPMLPDLPAGSPLPTLQSQYTVSYQTLGQAARRDDPNQKMMLTLQSRPMVVPAGEQVDMSMAMFAGPRERDLLSQEPYRTLNLAPMVRYEMGCTWCTFQWLARFLLRFLEGIHFVLRDWALAIIVLVLVVRLILHPITRRAQINMTKMQKQMAALQPETEKLKKKYKDDQQRLQQEMMKLYREKGVNVTGFLGCLPMFLQMPIWVALYAMLYFAIELRHEPAFYGVFQTISGGAWSFLADLSSPDRFIVFSETAKPISLLFIRFDWSSLNILPLIMGVTFFIQSSLTSPPPANEQMAQQQKMMKYMMLLFPVFLYSAPSGLTLYMMASSWAAIVDSYVVRKHIRQQEEAGTLFDDAKAKKPRKPGGLMDRLHKTLEAKQQQMIEQQRRSQQRPPRRKK